MKRFIVLLITLLLTASALAETAGLRVYMAGPMFNAAEKDFNLKIAKVLEAHGYQVFLPQRDGIAPDQLSGKSEEEMAEIIFQSDVLELQNSDILLMNMDGRVPDEGACVELGIAWAIGKRCYGFKTDTHAAERGMDLNPMIAGAMTRIFENYDGDQLIEEIEAWLADHKL